MRHRTDYIVVHCSATGPTSDIGVDEIRDWHKAKGWSDVGYHAVIRRDGEIEFGRHFDEPGAHVKGQNYRSVGVCMVGGVDANGSAENNFTPPQFTSLKVILAMLRLAYSRSVIVGHRDLSPDLDGDGVVEKHEWLKECPSFDVVKWAKGELE
jgi:N-acetyl-anhydromuramyl-L-alanine amidase AmpD